MNDEDIIRNKFHVFSPTQWEQIKLLWPYNEIPFITDIIRKDERSKCMTAVETIKFLSHFEPSIHPDVKDIQHTIMAASLSQINKIAEELLAMFNTQIKKKDDDPE